MRGERRDRGSKLRRWVAQASQEQYGYGKDKKEKIAKCKKQKDRFYFVAVVDWSWHAELITFDDHACELRLDE